MQTNFSTIWDGESDAFEALAQNCIAVYEDGTDIEYIVEFDIIQSPESDNELETSNKTLICITDIWQS